MTAPEPDEHVIVLMPTRGNAGALLLPGTVVTTADCGHRAFIAPTAVAYLARDPLPAPRLLCSDCVPPDVMTDPATDRSLLPGARAELEGAFGVAAADQLTAWARDHGLTEPPA